MGIRKWYMERRANREAQIESNIKELNFLDTVFHALRMDDICVHYTVFGNLVGKDFDGNKWKNAALYEFILNECLTFNLDGTLIDGLYLREDILHDLLTYAQSYGVYPIGHIGKEVN